LSDSKSGSATPPPSTPPAAPPATPPTTPSTPAQISIDQALTELETKKRELKVAQDTIIDLTTQLKAANDVLEAQEKAKLIGEILPRTDYTIEDLTKMSIDQLKEINGTLNRAKTGIFKNIRLGPMGTNEAQAPNLTVGSKFAFDKKGKRD